MDNRNLALFQLCDSNFPTGAFSHSYGLESYIQEDRVRDQATFAEWLHTFVHGQLVYADGLAVRLAHEALQNGNLDDIWKLDRMLHAQNLPRETREGTQKMGERMLGLVGTLYPEPALSAYRKRIAAKQSFGHPALVFAMAGYHLEASGPATVLYYLYSVVSSLVQNAVRAIPLGQTAGQKVLRHFQEEIAVAAEKVGRMDRDDFGIVSPGLERSQMEHERIHVRIFMS
ncbi:MULTISPECIES: urease accessory protein UreF [Paenibacillus]|uniref:Urease accessory protein UreF n=1 Tax=Paenibacillus albilobatus TaxID=2716884 RepID=A0A919XGG2_9BACL|nr:MULTISPECIES: urease accessory protein UreF [Paenibacillus]GIO30095.1 urease accessory protein UreF [Paenibacillus albilobatus]